MRGGEVLETIILGSGTLNLEITNLKNSIIRKEL